MCAEMCPCRQREVSQRSKSAGKENALPVLALTLFRREALLLLLWGVAASAGCRRNIVRRLRFSSFEWETFACFPHVLCTEGLAYLKTAAVRKNLKEPANGNACVSTWWANAALERTNTKTLFYRRDLLPPSHTCRKNARSADEAAEFTCRILRLV